MTERSKDDAEWQAELNPDRYQVLAAGRPRRRGPAS